MNNRLQLIRPDWPAPKSVVALTSCRSGGHSAAPWDSLNLGLHVGDNAADVHGNRALLASACEGLQSIQWLDQVHGVEVVHALPGAVGAPSADASISNTPGVACAVMTADCLPVLFSNLDGTAVAAAHAGWRGLAAGVLENTVARFACPGDQLLVWLGPAIGPQSFEVGPEVMATFITDEQGPAAEQLASFFQPSPDRKGHFLADLYALARYRLAAVGVHAVYGGGYCTYRDTQRFYSFRRDGQTGRMVTLIYRT